MHKVSLSCFKAMISSRFEILLILLRLVLLFPNSTEALGVPQKLVPDICLGNISSSVYQKNVNDLLSSLLSQGNGSGFYSSSRGQSPDKVYAIGLCRGDVEPDVCGKCISDATYILTESCPNGTEATGWYDNCMLRYSKRPLYGVMESNKPSLRMCSPYDIGLENTDDFNRKLTALLGRLKSAAAAGGDLLKYAAGNTTFGSMSQSIFAVLQCTPDLSEMDCSKCLGDTVESLPTTCPAKHGARIDFLSCYLRYEDALFFNSVVAATPPPISPPPPGLGLGEKKQSKNSRTVIIIVVATTVPLLLILSICIYLKLRKTKARFEDCIHEPGAEALQFDFDSIKVATNNFSKSNELGRGGFGVVYKGKLWNQEDIAVKRLSKNSAQGDIEFKNEVVLAAKLQHRNLVKLLGFCLEKNERLLVYEFVSNSSLDNFIFDPKMRHLDWDTRYKIIVGIGRGLLYLHEDSRLRIIHRDLKASNVLLDAEMTPKIADFGMAKLFDFDQTQGQTSRIAGTHGYMAPEYVMRGHFSVKSDVYSFGVLVLEIVSGEKNNSFYHGKHAEDLISYNIAGMEKLERRNSFKSNRSSHLDH
ncbi:cysteine-rich receptor-like protein kinase 29 isoform X2 [Rosa rugosa]|uniref:cysteine-rich receptor-like protein kinase 29 isoform X2 n=1 Tax=Rosa rugosa TaxID=74645 RepID=UPI002B40E798|nr:cysteine-rich receptor-like protein kinase 29 isoform X2 [Rosa rugosa]